MEAPSSDPILADRISAIVQTEKRIDDMMRCTREIIQDLVKEKQISKNKMDDNANTFKKLITQVENELSAQMQYLSHVCVGSSHQGSTFGVLQNSLLAQAGCSSLHSELAGILSAVDPPTGVLDEGVVVLDEQPEQDAEEVEEEAEATAEDVAMTSSPSEGAADGDASSQEDMQRLSEEEELMED